MSVSTADLIRGGAQSATAGKPLDSDALVPGDATSSTSPATEESEYEVRAENSVVDSLSDDVKDSEEGTESKDLSDSDSEEPASSEKSSKKASDSTPQKEVVTVTDDKGRRKIEVDLSNKEEVKKYVQMAYGARKWQAERDQALKTQKEIQTQLEQIKQNWDALEKAFQERGEEGVVDLIAGKPGAYKEKMKQQLQREEFLRNATPEEIEALQAKEQAEKAAKELEKIRKENEEFRKKIESEKEEADLRNLESRVHPVFDKYRFEGKLGDADDEQMFDEMLWNTALKRLEPYEEQGISLSPDIIEKEFSTVAKSLRKRMSVQAEKKAARVIEQKKKEATENVQATVKSGYNTGGLSKEAGDMINSGNLTGLLKNWGKYGSVFNSGKK